MSKLEPGYDERNKRCMMVPPEPVDFSLLPAPKQQVPDQSTSTEPTTGEGEDDLGIEDISNMELYEGCDDQAASAGEVGAKPRDGAKPAEKTC